METDDFIQGQRLLINSRLDAAEACFRRAVDQGYAGGLMGFPSVEHERGNLAAARLQDHDDAVIARARLARRQNADARKRDCQTEAAR